MAILWADNFDNYGLDETKLTDGIYAEVSSGTTLAVDPDVGETGNCIKFATASTVVAPQRGNVLRMVYPGSGLTTAGFAFRLYMDSLPASANDYRSFGFTDINNVGQVIFKILADGSVRAYRADAGNSPANEPVNILGTTAPVLTTGAWTHVEVKVLISDTVGTVELRINGVPKLTLTGQDTLNIAATDIRQIYFGCGAVGGIIPGQDYFIKDLILWDTTGTANNDFIGTCHVYTLKPDADSTFTWTPSTGTTGFNLIDETTPDDADYISAGDPPPALSEFGVANLPPDIVGVKALLPIVRAKKIDGGDGNIQTGVKGTLTDLGTDRPITTTFTYWWDVSELSPDTGVSWTPTEVNNAKLTVNRTI